MSPIELVAVAAGLVSVYLTTRRSVWCWPTGLVQVVLFVWIFYEAKLYSDVLLHVVYTVLQLYGWHHWLFGGRDASPPPVTRISPVAAAAWAGAGAAGTAGLGFAMSRLTDASYPFWDASIACYSLVAQYLLARKIFENWFFWIAVDLAAIPLYWVKDLRLTAGLYVAFLTLCVVGVIAWRRSLPGRGPG